MLEVGDVLLVSDEILVIGEGAAPPHLLVILGVSNFEVLNTINNFIELALVDLDDTVDEW